MDSAVGACRIVGDARDLGVWDIHMMRGVASHAIHPETLSLSDDLAAIAIVCADTEQSV